MGIKKIFSFQSRRGHFLSILFWFSKRLFSRLGLVLDGVNNESLNKFFEHTHKEFSIHRKTIMMMMRLHKKIFSLWAHAIYEILIRTALEAFFFSEGVSYDKRLFHLSLLHSETKEIHHELFYLCFHSSKYWNEKGEKLQRLYREKTPHTHCRLSH